MATGPSPTAAAAVNTSPPNTNDINAADQRTVGLLEESIYCLSQQLKDLSRELQKMDFEVVHLLRDYEGGNNNYQLLNEQVTKMLKEQEILQNRFIITRKEKEKKMKELRDAWMKVIKANPGIRVSIQMNTSIYTQPHSISEPSGEEIRQLAQRTNYIKDSEICLINVDEHNNSSLLQKEKLLRGRSLHSRIFEGRFHEINVAVKVLDDTKNQSIIDQFKRECDTLRIILAHPSLLLYIGSCIENEKHQIVWERTANGSLEWILAQPGHNIHYPTKITILIKICEGMTWLHSQSNLHLHLNPSNILLTNNWDVKIAEYGLANYEYDFCSTSCMEDKSIYYTAPELLLNSNRKTKKCDIYSFGILAWALFMETDPFNIRDAQQFKIHVNNGGRPKIPEKARPRLIKLLQECWDHVPEQRKDFERITKEDWDAIKSLTDDEREAREMWDKIGKGHSPNQVPWVDFAKNFCSFLNLTPEQPDFITTTDWKCLAAILQVKDGLVEKKYFETFLQWFPPTRTGSVLTEIKTLIEQEWFFGNISSSDANDLLAAEFSQKREPVFLVRFGISSACYTVCYFTKQNQKKQENKMKLHRYAYPTVSSLISRVEELRKQNRWKACTFGRTNFDAAFCDIKQSIYVNVKEEK